MFSDEATGELLCDSEQLNTALQTERQALQAERQALEAERQAHLKTLEAYQVAEVEIVRLRALLERK